MKRAAVLVMILALVAGYGVTALAKGNPADQHPPTHRCYFDTVCFDYYICIVHKCCTDCVWTQGGYDCVTNCVPIS